MSKVKRMKPVFKKERDLLIRKLGFELPENIWRDGHSLYLNSDCETRIIKFKVYNRETIKVTWNKIQEVLKKYKNKTIEEEILESTDRLDRLEQESIEKSIEYIKENPGYEIRAGISGGIDSDLINHILSKKVFPELGITDYTLDFMNSTNETPQTYLHIKRDFPEDKLQINNPPKGLYMWLKEDKQYYIPTIASRTCCSTYKEGRLRKILNKNTNYIIFLGMRKSESNNRSEYDWDLNERMNELYKKTKKDRYKLYIPANWKRFLPILNWDDKDVWLYTLREGNIYNEQYNMGFNRCGCLICPYMSDYNELLVKYYYPSLSKRWDDMLHIHYKVKDVSRRLKYSKLEFINQGKWKSGGGKEQELMNKKATPDRIMELARIKGCTELVAAKFFKRKCSCNKKLNPEEVAMYLKFFGRFVRKEYDLSFNAQASFFDNENNFSIDDRQYLCKRCFCAYMGVEEKEYEERVRLFRQTGCSLF